MDELFRVIGNAEASFFGKMPATLRPEIPIRDAKFDEILPDYVWLSDVKKIDFFLWSIRQNENNHINRKEENHVF